MHYIMRLKTKKTSGSNRVDRIQADSLIEAKQFFIGRKQMNEEQFDKLYIVELDETHPTMMDTPDSMTDR